MQDEEARRLLEEEEEEETLLDTFLSYFLFDSDYISATH